MVGVLLALGYMISSLFGIGILVLPRVIQQVGLIYFLVFLTLIAVALNLAAFIIFELIQMTGDNVEASVRAFLGKYSSLATASYGIFVYGALTAYVLAAGDQLSTWLGGSSHYWSSLFFVLAIIPAIGGLMVAATTSAYISMFLIALLLFLIPVNLRFDSFIIPLYGSFSQVPLLVLLSAFALAGHFSIYEVHRLVRDEKSSAKIFFAAFALAFLVYIAFGITAAATSPALSELSTATLAQIYPPFYALLVSSIALLAFYTSFIVVAHSFIRVFENHVSRKTTYALLLLPISVLYLLVRDYRVFSLTTLIGKFGGVGLLAFLSLACFAHHKASKKWKTHIPGVISKSLGVIFAASGVIGIFL